MSKKLKGGWVRPSGIEDMRKGLSESLRNFSGGSGKKVFFVLLFYSLWFAVSLINNRGYELESFKGRMIGIATLEAYGVGSRVSLFYVAFLALAGGFVTLGLCAYFLFRAFPALENRTELSIVNYASLAGIFLFLFMPFGHDVTESLELIYFTHKLMVAGFLLTLFTKKRPDVSVYSIVTCMAVAGYFLISDVNSLLGYAGKPDIYIVTFAICLLLLFMYLLFRPGGTSDRQGEKLTYGLLPVILLPCLSVLKDEIFLILKSNDIAGLRLETIYIILCLVLIAAIFLRLRSDRGPDKISTARMVKYGYFPMIIFSLLVYTYYAHFVQYSGEAFEAGNNFLPIMELKDFGVIPTLEKFNSHLVSDYFFGLFYAFFHGLQGEAMGLYDFLLVPVSATLFYFLLTFITGNAYLAIFLVMMFPVTTSVMPGGFCVSIVGLFSLRKVLISGGTLLSYLGFFFVIALLILWRIDVGFCCIVIMPLIILYYHFSNSDFRIRFPLLLKALLIVPAFFATMLTVLSIVRDVNLFEKMIYALNYFASAQTYGYTSVGISASASFAMTYFVYPAAVGLILIMLLVRFRTESPGSERGLMFLSLLFMCGYYVMNFNRGLIRHSLWEHTEVYTSSFIYLIVPAFLILNGGFTGMAVRSLIFIVIPFLLVEAFGVADTHRSTGAFESLVKKTRSEEIIDLENVTGRIKGIDSAAADRNREFASYIKNTLKGDETFIDFSGNPMLHYYTGRQTPSYFYQNPLCNHNDLLQDMFISDLRNYNAPYLLYNTLFDWGEDNVDGVPNTLRHYRMAEHFHNNYEPYIILGKFCLWKHKSVSGTNTRDTIVIFNDLRGMSATITSQLYLKPGKKYLVRMVLRSKAEPVLKYFSGKDTIYAEVRPVSEQLAFAEIGNEFEECGIIVQNSHGQINKIEIIAADQIPDYYSEKYATYEFKKLPYIWGKYDKRLDNEQIIATNKTSDRPNVLPLAPDIDRSSGNTVVVRITNTSGKNQKAVLCFGDSALPDRTAVYFEVLHSVSGEDYAIRTSSIYRWYRCSVNQIIVLTEEHQGLKVESIKVTKGS